MSQLAGSFYLICTAAFALFSFVIGLRLIRLSQKTEQIPEFLLGWGLVLTGSLGYGLLITSGIARVSGVSMASVVALTILGKLLLNTGVMCTLLFMILVFRPNEPWAKGLAGSLAAVLWIGFAGLCLTGGLESGMPEGWYWVEFAVIGSYPLWTCFEAFRYWATLRKREALGLADPLIVNRFLLWGLASILSLAAIWVVNLPALIGTAEMGIASPFMGTCMIAASVFGTACVSMYWMTFFPPHWYAARLIAQSGRDHSD